MSKVKAIIFGVLVLLFFGMGVAIQQLAKSNKANKDRGDRLWNNILNYKADSAQYLYEIYTQKEFTRVISDSLRDALDSLKIRPKEVQKIIYRYITDIDTVEKPVYVYPEIKNNWLITDTGQCFVWKAKAILTDTTLNVKRTEFSYHNSTTDYYYVVRPHKFLCFRWGKKQIKRVAVPKCGTASESIIEVIK